MTIEPPPLSAERRAEIEAEHANCPTPGCTPRDLMSALLHAEQRIAELEAGLKSIADADDTGIVTVAFIKHWAHEALEAQP